MLYIFRYCASRVITGRARHNVVVSAHKAHLDSGLRRRLTSRYLQAEQQFLNFFPLKQGHGSLRLSLNGLPLM